MLKIIREDKLWFTGLLLLLLAVVIFAAPALFRLDDDGGLCILNYLLVIVYFVCLLISGRLRRGRKGLAPLFMLLLIFLVSCYSLNRSFRLFNESVPWFCAVLITSAVNYLSLPFYDSLPRYLKYLVCTIAGISLFAFLYLALYLLPDYLMSAITSPALGFSLHTFVPLLFVIYTLVFIYRAAQAHKPVLIAFAFGLLTALTVTIQFVVRWQYEVTRVEDTIDESLHAADNDLPTWVAVAQNCQPTTFNEHFLKTGIVYEIPSDWNFFFWEGRRNFDEQRKHDPLIVIACFFYGKSSLAEADRISILKCLYDSRHQARERLWSGDDLATTYVDTDVDIWPQLHLSYTQEDITVTNKSLRTKWGSPQEAIYSFHLPEGAVVSSLSLWINGREEKAVLSSRHKADSAYTTIVGERHDPSVVHWQEGNTVVVRVFPVPPAESRHFKIGITAPLEKKAGQLAFHSCYFDGPPADAAKASIHINPMQALVHANTFPPLHGAYQPDWSLHFDDPGVASAVFRFNGRQYTTDTYIPVFETVDIRRVYLDLNKSWTPQEFDSVLSALSGKAVYAWQPDNGLVGITADNKKEVFNSCSQQQFSLFPLDVIADKENALLISKSSLTSPALSDLNYPRFTKRLQHFLNNPGRLCLFNLGDELSPYLKTLKECGAFRFEKGDQAALHQRLREHQFIRDAAQPGLALIDPAGLLIRSSAADTTRPAGIQAPDHLLRVFAYRQIMQQMNGLLPGDFTWQDPGELDTLVRTAQEANIVTPVSSLVVLEKEEDYKRFDIAQSENSLHDATLHGKGAVPEPGEWALLLLVIAVFVFIRLRAAHKETSTKPL